MNPSRTSNRTLAIAAGLLLGFQAALGALVSLLLFASAHRLRVHHWTVAHLAARHRAGVGLFVLLVAVVVVVLAVGVIRGWAWARAGALAFEIVSVLGASLRFGMHPGGALGSMLLAAAVVALILMSDGHGQGDTTDPRDRGPRQPEQPRPA
jgi:hypothetical protein